MSEMFWKRIKENNQNIGKTSWVVSQTPTPKPEHDKIQAQWALNIPSKSMLERVWWWRHCEMEFWSWTICYLMSCSNRGRHT